MQCYLCLWHAVVGMQLSATQDQDELIWLRQCTRSLERYLLVYPCVITFVSISRFL